MSLGRVVGTCRACNVKAREAHVVPEDIVDALGERTVYRHVAIQRKGPRDPGKPCHGYVVPLDSFLHPPPAQYALEAFQEAR